MVVNSLTNLNVSILEMVEFAQNIGARVSSGTDMKVLGDGIANVYQFNVERTNDINILKSALQNSAVAIINVGGDRTGYKGVFSDGGHYLIAYGVLDDGDTIMMVDPYMYSGKYSASYRQAVTVVRDFIYAASAVVDKDASNRNPRYTIFTKKS